MMVSHASLTLACHARWTSDDFATRPALIHDDGALTRVITYAELAERVGRLAAALHAQGMARGALVALAMERSVDQVLALFAALWAGACPCPLEPGLARDEVDARLASVGIDVLLHDAAHAPLAERQTVRTLAFGQLDASATALAPWHDAALDTADRALLLFTSGSTGRPKGVLLTHGNLLSNVAGIVPHTGLTADDRLLHVMPLYHTNGLNNQLFAPWLVGASVVLAGRFKADAMPALMERHRPTLITGVPTMYARMLPLDFTPAGLAALRMARCGSAPITPELHRRIETKLGCPLVVSYGLSEATCTSTMNPPGQRKIGTVGTVLAGQQVRLLEPNGPAEMPPGAEGEICIGGPNLMAGYLGADTKIADDANRAVRDGWLRTGDLGRFDEDGYLSVTGRLKDVIIRGGENLSPLLIESVIVEEDGVAACCVVGQPHADLGEVPVAFVTPRPGAALDAAKIGERVRQRLSRIYQPHAVFFVERLPETAVGKVDRKTLAKRAKERLAEGEVGTV